MRPIKFRAWDKTLNEMQELPFGEDMYWYEENFVSDFSDFDVMQFTGLHDKNGKEIYEGDVVKTPQQKYIKQWVVEYDYDGNLILSNQINSEMSLYDFEDMILNKENCYIKDIEVIGNIHENPDLCPPSN